MALRWNEAEGQLEYAASGTLEEAPIARGIDWILTRNFIIQATEEAPYTQVTELLDPIQSTIYMFNIPRL